MDERREVYNSIARSALFFPYYFFVALGCDVASYLAATPAQQGGQPREPLRYWIPLRKQKVPRHLNRLLKMAALLQRLLRVM